jgi:hypothetical protein
VRTATTMKLCDTLIDISAEIVHVVSRSVA